MSIYAWQYGEEGPAQSSAPLFPDLLPVDALKVLNWFVKSEVIGFPVRDVCLIDDESSVRRASGAAFQTKLMQWSSQPVAWFERGPSSGNGSNRAYYQFEPRQANVYA